MQAHRTAKNIDTDTSILDAVSEEINNSIFRKGHVNLGLSSALIGSGMAFDYKWFKSNIHNLKSTGEDKELELLLLRDRIFVEYLDYIDVYDEKTTKTKAFYNQRRRWLATQFYILRSSIKYFPLAILNNWPLADKIIQWMLFPRILQLGLIGLFTILATIIDFSIAFKWWCLLSLLLITLIISIPKELFNRRLLLALHRIPLLFILMFLNLFRLRGASKNFIHTEKNQ
jgi:cellulose synthase/poly-beta-1,6-N-acetylglucosamine synthase-like glycosyltransferase